MLGAILDFSLRHRFLVLTLTILVVALGMFSAGQLPFDAIPDVMNVQVQVLTNATALGPLEVEQLITVPIESALRGIPRVERVRSVSKFGLSLVSVVFDEGTDIYWARSQVNERLARIRNGIPPEYGQPGS